MQSFFWIMNGIPFRPDYQELHRRGVLKQGGELLLYIV
jgi:hypothetical protein